MADIGTLIALCRDCLWLAEKKPAKARCPRCASPRLVVHAELGRLTIAHADCDAFYASVEKRDRPELADLPVIVGGGRRGVVSAACYVARTYGVRSAMPMFKALAACPDAVVIRPDMDKYAAVSREVRALMLAVTPLVEPLSLDEAFLDLAGTEALHGLPPAASLARLAREVESKIGISLSIGLAPNKFLAKIASDLDKPRGFAVIGASEAEAFLAERPVELIFGVGQAMRARLAADGLRRIGQLRDLSEKELTRRYGAIGHRLARFARGEDERKVEPERETKSISAETTFSRDLSDPAELERELWSLCENVAGRVKRSGLAGGAAMLKLKTRRFKLVTRRRKLARPTPLAGVLFEALRPLLAELADGAEFRLIGAGFEELVPVEAAAAPDLFEREAQTRKRQEDAIDAVRARFGGDAIATGRGFVAKPKRK
ncbi:MAG: DNA polymerase IV [Alphaproteobacteria bacterium]|nr:DNA polymerase IV [Alphaproteobacteria bacterium]